MSYNPSDSDSSKKSGISRHEFNEALANQKREITNNFTQTMADIKKDMIQTITKLMSTPLPNQSYSSDLGNVTANFGLDDFRPSGRDRDTSPQSSLEEGFTIRSKSNARKESLAPKTSSARSNGPSVRILSKKTTKRESAAFKTPAATEQKTFFPAHQVGVSNVVVARQEKELEEHEKLQTLSLKGYMATLNSYREYISTNKNNPLRRTLVHYISRKVLMQCVMYEAKMGTDLSLTVNENNVFERSDSEINIMLARGILSTIRSSDKIGVLVFKAMITKFKADAVLQTDSWDVKVTPTLKAIIYEVPAMLNFLEEGNKNLDSAFKLNFPPRGWGSDANPGKNKILLECFHPFKSVFVRILGGEEEVKKIGTLSELVGRIEEIDTALYCKSQIAARDRELLKDPVKLEIAFGKVRDDDITEKFRAGLKEKAFNLPLGTPARKPGEFKQEKGEKRLFAREGDDENIDGGEEDVLDGADLKKWAENEVSEHSHLNYLQQRKASSSIRTYDPKPKERTLACFSHFRGACESGSACVYSHTKEAMEEYGEHMVKLLFNSSFMGAKKVREVLVKLETAPRVDRNSTTVAIKLLETPDPAKLDSTKEVEVDED